MKQSVGMELRDQWKESVSRSFAFQDSFQITANEVYATLCSLDLEFPVLGKHTNKLERNI